MTTVVGSVRRWSVLRNHKYRRRSASARWPSKRGQEDTCSSCQYIVALFSCDSLSRRLTMVSSLFFQTSTCKSSLYSGPPSDCI